MIRRNSRGRVYVHYVITADRGQVECRTERPLDGGSRPCQCERVIIKWVD